MANQLGMDKTIAIKHLRQSGLSQQAIADALGISRGAVIRHLASIESNSTKAPTGETPTGSETSNSTEAPTGSDAKVPPPQNASSRSHCEPFREIIRAKLELGLDSQRIFQDLIQEHGFNYKYWSVNRFIRGLGKGTELPFRRMEVEPGWELQVDFGMGRPCKVHTNTMLNQVIVE